MSKVYAEILKHALSIVDQKVRSNYLRQERELKRNIRNEEAKIQNNPTDVLDSKLDDFYFELQLLNSGLIETSRQNLAD